MPRSLTLIAACLLALVVCSPGRSQDSHGDTARESQKDREGRPPAKVFTNEDMHPVSEGISAALGAGPTRDADKQDSEGHDVDNHSGNRSGNESLEKLQEMLDPLASMDRTTLVQSALQGQDADFPGRAKWEELLFAAKQTYVAQARDVIQKARQIVASADSLKGIQDQNDPRVKDMNARLQVLI